MVAEPKRGSLNRCTLSRRRLLAAGAGTAAATALMAACKTGGGAKSGGSASVSPAGAAAAKRGGALTAYLTTAPSEDLETAGARSNASASQSMFALVYSGLLRLKLGPTYKFTDRTMEGVLAANWEQPDPQTFVFHLRPGVKFHDKPPVSGRELNSADVKFSFERLLASPFAYLNFYSSISSIDAPDPRTVVFKMKAPDATLLLHLSAGFGWITAKEAGKADPKAPMGLSFKDPSTAIGTGPFMLDRYEPGARAAFVRNPQYFESGLPYLDRAELLFLTDNATQLAALQSGQAMLGQLPAGSEADFKTRNPKLLYNQQFSPNAWHHGLRVDQKPFMDVRVRRALAMAYDQSEVKKIMGTSDAPDSYGSLTAITGDAYLPLDKLGDNGRWWKVNTADAKQMLAAAGVANGFETDYNDSTCCAPNFLAEQLAADFARVGVKVNIKVKEHPAYQATTARGEYDGMAGSQVPVYDADDWFSIVLLPGTGRNVSHVNDTTVNDLTAKQRAELDPQKRLDRIHELVRYLAGQVYQIVEPQNIITEGRQSFVKNYAPRLGYPQTLSVVWLDK